MIITVIIITTLVNYLYILHYHHYHHFFRHRINTHDFKVIDFLANKIVLQVECGQQHNICRVIDRITIKKNNNNDNTDNNTTNSIATTTSNDDSSSLPSLASSSSSGSGDVYVWGNGILGQLGLGRYH